MAVYVDDMAFPFGRMLMHHMVADTSEELHAMADLIGVRPRWCQHRGTYREHYDIAQTKRARALAAGAVAITWRRYAEMIVDRRKAAEAAAKFPPSTAPYPEGGFHG